MEASTVYYTDFRCPVGTSLTEKLRRLCLAAGIKNIDMDGKFVAHQDALWGAGQPGVPAPQLRQSGGGPVQGAGPASRS